VGDRREHERRLCDSCKRHEEDPVREIVEEVRRSLNRQAGLSGTAGPRQRQQTQPRSSKERDDICQFLLPADHDRRLRGEVRRSVVERRKRWKLAAKPLCEELEDSLRLCQVLQPMLAQVAQSEPLRQFSLHELARGLRDEHLAAVTGRGDPSPPV
jgi:hypothetical protein